jgi:hypothetical protein
MGDKIMSSTRLCPQTCARRLPPCERDEDKAKEDSVYGLMLHDYVRMCSSNWPACDRHRLQWIRAQALHMGVTHRRFARLLSLWMIHDSTLCGVPYVSFLLHTMVRCTCGHCVQDVVDMGVCVHSVYDNGSCTVSALHAAWDPTFAAQMPRAARERAVQALLQAGAHPQFFLVQVRSPAWLLPLWRDIHSQSAVWDHACGKWVRWHGRTARRSWLAVGAEAK